MFSLPAIVLRDHLVLCDADRLQVLNPTARRLWEIHQETQDAERTVAWLVNMRARRHVPVTGFRQSLPE